MIADVRRARHDTAAYLTYGILANASPIWAGAPARVDIIRSVVGNVGLAGAVSVHHVNLIVGAEFERVQVCRRRTRSWSHRGCRPGHNHQLMSY